VILLLLQLLIKVLLAIFRSESSVYTDAVDHVLEACFYCVSQLEPTEYHKQAGQSTLDGGSLFILVVIMGARSHLHKQFLDFHRLFVNIVRRLIFGLSN
jgi:hypothetical protein